MKSWLIYYLFLSSVVFILITVFKFFVDPLASPVQKCLKIYYAHFLLHSFYSAGKNIFTSETNGQIAMKCTIMAQTLPYWNKKIFYGRIMLPGDLFLQPKINYFHWTSSWCWLTRSGSDSAFRLIWEVRADQSDYGVQQDVMLRKMHSMLALWVHNCQSIVLKHLVYVCDRTCLHVVTVRHLSKKKKKLFRLENILPLTFYL